MATRYPQKLLTLKPETNYSAKRIADICGVAERTVYRWYREGFLDRDHDFGQTVFQIKANLIPDKDRPKVDVPRTYTDAELEDFRLQMLQGKKDIQLNVTELVLNNVDYRTWQAALKGLDEIREFVAYMARRD